MYGDELSERRLKTGDLYVIPAGSAFYLVNLGEGQRLHIICSIDTSTSMDDTFQVRVHNFTSFISLSALSFLNIVLSFDQSLTLFNFIWAMQSFYIGGGDNSQSILAGFEPVILETAFNVS